jgi:hypothetical protein
MRNGRRIMLKVFIVLVCLGLLSACDFIPRGSDITVDHGRADAGAIPATWVDRVKTMAVYFEHASVGGNIMDGLDALTASDPGRYTVGRWSATDRTAIAAWFDANSGFVDNPRGNPGLQAKIDYFAATMGTNLPARLDVAMFKFCFIDDTGTAADAFAAQRTAVQAVQAAHPDVTVVWWTMPIMTDGSARRDDFNNLVRDYCRAYRQALFDIADIECHSPAGVRQTDTQSREVLYSGYSADGGHLNAAGSLRVANAWWVLCARLAGWNGV